MKKPLHPVTDHAVIRYLERVKGIDVEAIRREIGQKVDRAVSQAPGVYAVVIDGYRYRIGDGGVVITIMESSLPDLRTGRQRRERPE